MSKIALPQKVEFKKGETPNEAQVVIEPCCPGYGATLGNALRRVLISSLPGAAVIGVKIKGADHEFMTLPHVKEDVMEIILNLKQLRLKVHTDEVIKLKLDVHGEKDVKASNIEKNSDVEIVNPDLILAHVTDMAGSLNMEISVSRGLGYETVESREENKDKEIGFIEIDSIFSPVLKVGIDIDNVRVGKMTNWDKLVLNIATDGTITPDEAFTKAVEILIKQFGSLVPGAAKAEEKEEEKEEMENKEEPAKEGPKKKRGRPKKGE